MGRLRNVLRFGSRSAILLTAVASIAVALVIFKRESLKTSSHFTWRDAWSSIGKSQSLKRTPHRSPVTAPINRLGNGDPTEALELVAQTTANSDERNSRQAEILTAWARRSPRQAWAWVRDHVDYRSHDGEEPAAVGLWQAIAVRDPTLAISFVNTMSATLSDAADQRQLTDVAVVALVTTGHVDLARAAIDEWLQQHQPIDERTLTTVVLALAAARSSAGAADWLTQLPGAERYGNVAATLAANWAERDPAAALQWAQSLPAAAQRDPAMNRVFAVWSDHDAAGATQWFLQHESLPDSDRLIPTFIDKSNLGAVDPAAALAWASLPRDASLRSTSFAIALRQWADRDPQTASRYLAQTTELPARDRTRLAAQLGLAVNPALPDRP